MPKKKIVVEDRVKTLDPVAEAQASAPEEPKVPRYKAFHQDKEFPQGEYDVKLKTEAEVIQCWYFKDEFYQIGNNSGVYSKDQVESYRTSIKAFKVDMDDPQPDTRVIIITGLEPENVYKALLNMAYTLSLKMIHKSDIDFNQRFAGKRPTVSPARFEHGMKFRLESEAKRLERRNRVQANYDKQQQGVNKTL